MAWEFLLNMPLWQKIAAYAFLLIGLFIFVKLGQLKVMNHPIVPMKWRIALALLFPVIFILGIFFGAIILGIAIGFVAFTLIVSLITRKKPKFPRIPKIRINVVKK